jgi:nucleotide-binding universal stress UspA family protein
MTQLAEFAKTDQPSRVAARRSVDVVDLPKQTGERCADRTIQFGRIGREPWEKFEFIDRTNEVPRHDLELDQYFALRWWPYGFDRRQASCMYTHILIPTDGSELSKMALEEGVALAKALGARVTVVTVTTPFHVITANREMLTYVPERYKEHMAALAAQYLEVGKNIATAAGVACDLVHIEHEHPYKAIIDTAQHRGCDAIEMAVARTTRDIGGLAR